MHGAGSIPAAAFRHEPVYKLFKGYDPGKEPIMAFNFSDLNKNSKKTIRDGINTEGMSFKPLRDFIGQTLKVDGFFFTNKGKWGKQVVIIANGVKINMPKRCTEEFEHIRDNDEALQAVIDGHMTITDIEKFDAKDGTTVVFKYGDC